MKHALLLLMILPHLVVSAQSSKPASVYDPRDIFPAASILPDGNPYRTATGEPGPAYWQNRADYVINASLDDQHHLIEGTVLVTYTNHSPGALPFLWFQLDQNAYAPHSRGLDAHLFLDSNEAKRHQVFAGGYRIHSVETVTAGKQSVHTAKADYLVSDTRMQVRLSTPLPAGGKLQLKIAYSYTIPEYFYNADFGSNRTDILPTKNGGIYSVCQWYPRLCVLDDVEGWNTLPYLGNGEFYLEYGDFQVNLTLPSAYIVEASGELLNPEEVLTPVELQRWKKAQNSEEKVFIRKPEEVTDPASRPSKPTCTWKFRMSNTRDFAWTASKSFIWEGIRIDLPGGKKVLGVSVYPIESKLPDSWDRSSEYVKFTIEYFSRHWYPYPWPCAVNVASNLGGMEYPGIVFCSSDNTGNPYWRVVNHELGHTWFPMIVGSNERKYAWMDEGFNLFIDNLATEDFNHHEFEGYESDNGLPEEYVSDSLPPLFTRPDGIRGDLVFPSQYRKTAYLLRLLRDHILGPDRFDYAFRKYINDWAFKHPRPADFFHSINSSAGEDLTWFWKSMFMKNYKLDQAVTGVEYIGGDPANGAGITVDNLQKAAMPLDIEITTVSGKKERHIFPVEIWEFTGHYVFKTKTTEAIERVRIDPGNLYPDVDRGNNEWGK